MKRVTEYIKTWEQCGYSDGIPDEVPEPLMRLGLAPSWKAIAICILKNDLQFTGLGFPAKNSEWYGALKKIEIEKRPESKIQMTIFEAL